MESISQKYPPQKVRCISIATGAIKSPIKKEAWGTTEALGKRDRLIPDKRFGVPKDIGRTAVWLASDKFEYINGTTIFLDGIMNYYPGFTKIGWGREPMPFGSKKIIIPG